MFTIIKIFYLRRAQSLHRQKYEAFEIYRLKIWDKFYDLIIKFNFIEFSIKKILKKRTLRV